MPTKVDPDQLLDAAVDSAQNIFIDTALRTILIRNNEASGNPNKGPVLDNTGVSHQALYSFLKKQWKDDPKGKDLIAYPFPLVAITPEQFEWRFGWRPADDTSRNLLRTGGWREFAIDNATLKRQYLGVISLGNIDGDQNQDEGGDQDTVYYGFFDSADGTSTAGPIDFSFPGEVNQAIQTYDSSDTTKDFRGDILRLFIRTEGKTYGQTDTTLIGLPAGTTLPFNTQRFPLVEGDDLNATVSDAVITAAQGSGQKYNNETGPRIEYKTTSVLSDTLFGTDLLDGPYPFGVLITNQDGTGSGELGNNDLYSWTQYKLRQDSDIEFEAGSIKNGKLADELLQFVGSTLKTKRVTNIDQGGSITGTVISPVATADINNVAFLSDSAGAAERAFPFSAGVTVTFSEDILADSASAKVFPFYTYTRAYSGNITIANVGPSVLGVSGQDSANFTLSGFSVTPVNTAQNPNGLAPAGAAEDQYFRVTGATTAGNNTIWRIRKAADSNTFSAYTLDDDPVPQGEGPFSGSIRNHPINSPGAIKLDSAGEDVENTGTDATLAPANLSSGAYTFSYAFDVNSQKDRKPKDVTAGDNVAVTIRALGLETGSWVEATGTIERINNNTFSVVSAVERNYSDPE